MVKVGFCAEDHSKSSNDGSNNNLRAGTSLTVTMADCRDYRRRGSIETNNLSQKKAADLQDFFSRLRIKEDPWRSKGRRGSADAVIHYREPRPSPLLEDGTGGRARQTAVDVFTNFEDRIRDSGGGKSYLYAPILPGTGGLLEAVVLSAWDNVVGPKAVFVWSLREDVEECVDTDLDVRDAVQYAVSHTLHGELGRESDSGCVEIYISQDHGFVLCSVPFSAEGDVESAPHSLAMILPSSRIGHFTDLYSLFCLWVQRLASSLRVLLHEVECRVAVAELSPTIMEFCTLLRSLSVASLSSHKILQNIDYACENSEFFSVRTPFLERAITSHLQTCCNSVVIGSTVEEVNSVIGMLALFLQPKERSLVRLAVKGEDSWPYHPGIYIQGMVKGSRGDLSISEDDVLLNPCPTTIIDLTRGKVMQSWLLHKHAQHRKLRFRKTLSSLLTNKNSAVPVTTRNIFNHVTEASKLVHSFLNEVWAIECDATRRALAVSRFVRQLEYHAFALVKFVQASSGTTVDSSLVPPSLNRKNLSKMLDIEEDVDFFLVLAVAERLRPGVYQVVMQSGNVGGQGEDFSLTN